MELFYIPKVLHSEAILDGDELHHATRVLRKQPGDTMQFTDGRGTRYSGVIEKLQKREARIRITDQETPAQSPYSVTVATALTKNIKRMEWCFEKMTELGVRTIIPLLCRRSERTTMNVDRMQKIVVSAMKQSERYMMPEISEPVTLQDVLDSNMPTCKCIGYRSSGSVPLTTYYNKGEDVVFLIGPEGDFTENEVSMAKTAGFQPVSFGTSRLRTETSGVFAVASVHILNM